MKHILTLVLLVSGIVAFAQQTYYSRVSGVDNEFTNPNNWSLDPSGEPAATSVPTPNDNLVIRDSIYHDAGVGYTHFGNVSIEKEGSYHVFTSNGISDPFFFKGDIFFIAGTLHTSSDFQNQDPSGNGELVFDRAANVFIGDDLILFGFTNMVMNNDSCGDGFTFDDIYFRGADTRICGVGRLYIPHQVRVWDNGNTELSQEVPNDAAPAELTDDAREQLRFQLCEGFKFYNDQQKCLDGEDELIEGDGDFSLPVELLRFYGRYHRGKVQLNWTTGSEQNNDFFTVERASDGSQFSPILTVKGAGNSQSLVNYNVFDENPPLGTAFYRLKQTDFDGSVEFSRVIEVTINADGPEIDVYPNPFDAEINVVVQGLPPKVPVRVSIFDLNGREMLRLQKDLDKLGTQEFTFPNNLSAGAYMVVANYSGQRIFKKVVKF